jgi:hypothetical protein
VRIVRTFEPFPEPILLPSDTLLRFGGQTRHNLSPIDPSPIERRGRYRAFCLGAPENISKRGPPNCRFLASLPRHARGRRNDKKERVVAGKGLLLKDGNRRK